MTTISSTPTRDCDYVDAKLDKRGKGCRERAAFMLMLFDLGAPDVTVPYAGALFYACRSHAKQVLDIVEGVVVELRKTSDAGKLGIRVLDVSMYPDVVKRAEDLANAMRTRVSQ